MDLVSALTVKFFNLCDAMGWCLQIVSQCFIVSYMYIMISAIDPCIYLHPDHNIEYITSQINTDPFVIYLGQKLSVDECQNSCIHLNYLCDKSIDDVYYDTNSDCEWQFDPQTCAITLLSPNRLESGSGLIVSPDIVSHEYIIEAQLTITSLFEAGVIWKSNIDSRAYFFGIDVKTPQALIQVQNTNTEIFLSVREPSSIVLNHNTSYNLTVHVIGAAFTSYINSEIFFATAAASEIDETIFTESYAGIYSYTANVIFDSFHIKFPHSNEMFCGAFVFNNESGDCYGYYGDNYTSLETSLISQNTYDSGIIYGTCAPSQQPSEAPLTTSEPSIIPTLIPSEEPSREAITTFSTLSTKTPSREAIASTSITAITTTTAIDLISSTHKSIYNYRILLNITLLQNELNATAIQQQLMPVIQDTIEMISDTNTVINDCDPVDIYHNISMKLHDKKTIVTLQIFECKQKPLDQLIAKYYNELKPVLLQNIQQDTNLIVYQETITLLVDFIFVNEAEIKDNIFTTYDNNIMDDNIIKQANTPDVLLIALVSLIAVLCISVIVVSLCTLYVYQKRNKNQQIDVQMTENNVATNNGQISDQITAGEYDDGESVEAQAFSLEGELVAGESNANDSNANDSNAIDSIANDNNVENKKCTLGEDQNEAQLADDEFIVHGSLKQETATYQTTDGENVNETIY